MNWLTPHLWVMSAALAGVIGAGVILGHLLRPRPRRRVLVTAMFWAEAVKATRGRVLPGRPARWLSLLLMLAAVSLACVALLSPVWHRGASRPVVLVLDNGSGVDVAAQAAAESRRVPPGRLTVVAASPWPRVLGVDEASGSHALRKLGWIGASDRAAAPGPTLRLAGQLAAATASRHGETAEVAVVTAEGSRWRRAWSALGNEDGLRLVAAPPATPNAGIAALTWEPRTPLGSEGVLRVGITARGFETGEASARVTARPIPTNVGEEAAEPIAATDVSLAAWPDSPGLRWVSLALPADGRRLRVTVAAPNDAYGEDDRMIVTMPARPAVSAVLRDGAPGALEAALRALGLSASRIPSSVWPDRDDNAIPETAAVIQSTDGGVLGAIALDDLDSGNRQGPLGHPVVGMGRLSDVDFEGARVRVGREVEGPDTDEDVEVLARAGGRTVAWLSPDRPEAGEGPSGGVLWLSRGWFDGVGTAAETAGFTVLLNRAVAAMAGVEQPFRVVSAERFGDDLAWRETASARTGSAGVEPAGWYAAPAAVPDDRYDNDSDRGSTEPSISGWRLRSPLLAAAAVLLAGAWWLHGREGL